MSVKHNSNHQIIDGSEKDYLSFSQKDFTDGDRLKAIATCKEGVEHFPTSIPLGVFLSQLYQQTTQFDCMLSVILKLNKAHPNDILVNIRKSECQIYAGEIQDSISTLDFIRIKLAKTVKVYEKLAELYIHCSQHDKAMLCHKKCIGFEPNNPEYLYNLSFSKLTHGEIDEAQNLIQQVIQKSPQDFDAYYSQSTLAKVTKKNNHISQLNNILHKFAKEPRAQISINYALGKEYEDIENYESAYTAIETAAKVRKQGMSYQVKTDVDAISDIIKTFSPSQFKQVQTSQSEETPIFIMGLPRSGTTLVEKILSTHRLVSTLGEMNSLAFSIMHCVGPHQGKLDLIQRSASIDFELLAEKYTHATRGYGIKSDYLIDKTPLNFLYIGLIKTAFPKAKIIHVRRHPLDSCFAMYKTLFRMGYPFSYDLSDLAEYYISYHRLMHHWRETYGDEIFDLDYESLVQDPENNIRSLLYYCDLDWQDDLINFHKNNSTSATASAAQIRKPIYQSSLYKWKKFEIQLAPLKTKLQQSGILNE